MRYLVTISYDGNNYYGFQKQPNQITIQQVIEEVISKVLNTETSIYASGRTDAKVHAKGQTFHFDTYKELDLGKFRYSLNCMLPKDIHVIEIKKVADDFHARLSAKLKKYTYVINMGEDSPFTSNYAYHLGQKLDVSLLQEAVIPLIGTRCYQNFTSKEEDEQNFIRTIHYVNFKQDGSMLSITFLGNGFMRYMIRMLVGSIIAIGLGKENISYFEEMLSKEERTITSYKAPAHGLFLEKVYYRQTLAINYHTHTKRCGHAFGEDEEYVEAAISHDMKVLGFSDHIFYPNFTGDRYKGVRGDYSLLDDYVNSLEALKGKYKDRVEIHVGFEAEYYDDYDWYYKELLESKKVEYLILGQHFVRENGITGSFLFHSQSTTGVKKYGHWLIKGMETGYFSYVCHPDLFLSGYEYFDETAKEITHRICQKSLELDIPLELNLGGVRRGLTFYQGGETRYQYPHYDFWKIVGEYGCKVVVGLDAHNPKDFDAFCYEIAQFLIDEFNLNVLTDYHL